jgi:Fe-S cluster biogenesis protein NfuA
MEIVEKQSYIEELNVALNEIRPHLQVDGGNVEVIDVTDDGFVHIKWEGNCEFCNMSAMTLKAGIEQTLKSKYPDLKGVKAINGLAQ